MSILLNSTRAIKKAVTIVNRMIKILLSQKKIFLVPRIKIY